MSELLLIQDDPWLEPYAGAITERIDRYRSLLAQESPRDFSHWHKRAGLHYCAESQSYRFLEYAPRAHALHLVGGFNDWSSESHPFEKDGEGNWVLELPQKAGFGHLSHYKIQVTGENGCHHRLSPFTQYAIQDEESKSFSSVCWNPLESYQWRHSAPEKPGSPLIYEAHVGIATEREGVGTYAEFRQNLLPRIARLGYNTIQLMAVAEHPYYGSFGYHVANFFAPSSRFGTPDELKALIDEAHGLGLTVLMDLVHSHTVKNFAEGLREYDGCPGYLLGEKEHPQWDSLLFAYDRPDTRSFLLSNLRYWMEEFHFDGFRFDGVTSMLYHNHGDTTFDHYDKYFGGEVAGDAVTYIQLANTLIRELNPNALIIAEDFSGMPGCCRPPEQGGLGFDYRLGMGVPDYWIKLLKHTPDEEWDFNDIWSQLSDRRYGEKTVSYTESHDQALVGDKTLAFWLMDQEMYWKMKKSDESPIVDRGIALHKLIRLLTLAVGGEAWLNFIGNEFGHPEWLDFPREGNDWSFKYARRQWNLADDPELKYEGLQNWEQALLELCRDQKLLESAPAQLLNIDAENRCLQFERGNLLFAINLNANESFADYSFRPHTEGVFQQILDSDQERFGGTGRLQEGSEHHALGGDPVRVYLPARCGIVLKLV